MGQPRWTERSRLLAGGHRAEITFPPVRIPSPSRAPRGDAAASRPDHLRETRLGASGHGRLARSTAPGDVVSHDDHTHRATPGCSYASSRDEGALAESDALSGGGWSVEESGQMMTSTTALAVPPGAGARQDAPASHAASARRGRGRATGPPTISPRVSTAQEDQAVVIHPGQVDLGTFTPSGDARASGPDEGASRGCGAPSEDGRSAREAGQVRSSTAGPIATPYPPRRRGRAGGPRRAAAPAAPARLSRTCPSRHSVRRTSR